MPHFKGQFPGPRLFQTLLRVYDFIARNRSRHFLTPAESMLWVPGLTGEKLAGASGFTDAVTDDSRLVLRLIAEAHHGQVQARNLPDGGGVEFSIQLPD